jgi:FkbM family methyltransferase
MTSKFSYMLRCIKLVKNWYFIPAIYFKLIRKNKITLQLRNKIKIIMRTRSTDIHVFANIWLNKEYKIDNFLDEKLTVIDIGAHGGYFTLYLSQLFPEAEIFCFEPIESNYQLLLENLKINDRKNVRPFHLAVTDKAKTAKIFLSDDDAAHNLYDESSKFEEIKTISLQEIMDKNKIESCGLLKLDCEGAEYEILNSFPLDYFNKIKRIILEYHIRNRNEFETLKDILKKMNYVVTDTPTSEKLGIILAEKNDLILF